MKWREGTLGVFIREATGCRGEIKKKEEESKGDDKFARNVVILGERLL